MEDDVKRLHQLLLEGKCCSSAIVQLGLEIKGEENSQLVQAVSGLCHGVHGMLICGALTGAACMMNLLDPKNANTKMIPELVEWFKATYGEKYGGINCADIVEDMPVNSKIRCPPLIEATYLEAKRILSSYGYHFE